MGNFIFKARGPQDLRPRINALRRKVREAGSEDGGTGMVVDVGGHGTSVSRVVWIF